MLSKLSASSALGVVLACALMSSGAHAEAAPAPAPEPQVNSDQAVEVIVTGEKTRRSLQKTNASVAVTTAKRIQDENLQTVYDVFRRTANVTETYGSNGFSIRGIRNDSVSGGGAGALATIYMDGAALPDTAVSSTSPLNMWDVRQVEIFRGPQSTLQGLNALAGAVIINSADPTADWSFRGRLMASDANETSVAVAGGGPITDTLGVRLSLEDSNAEGIVRNLTLNQNTDKTHILSTRGKLLWTPSDDLKVGLVVSHVERQGGYVYSYSRTDTPDWYDKRVEYSETDNYSRSMVNIATLTTDYHINDHWSLSAVLSANNVKTNGQYDGDYTAQPLSWGNNFINEKTISQEVRLAYKGNRLNGLIGLYHVKRDSLSFGGSLTNVPLPKPTLVGALMGLGLDNATATAAVNLYAQALPVIPVRYSSETPTELDNSALFLDGSYQLTDKLTLVGGLRYDYEDYTTGTAATAALSGSYPDPTNYGPYATVVAGLNGAIAAQIAQAGSATPESTRTFRAFLPKLGVKYQYTSDISAAFTVQRGYRAGGSAINTARSSVVPFDPEYTWNYEAALRTAWLDGTLTVNANIYYIDWTDQQVWVNLGLNTYDNQTENAGKSHLYGFEVEAAQRVSTAFQWYGSFGYSRTKFDDFTFQTGSTGLDYTGSEFAYAPHYTLAAGGTYRWTNGVFANLNASYTAGSFSDTENLNEPDYTVDSHTLVNTKLGYETDRYGIYLYANNLLDERYISYNRPDANIALPGMPRTVGLMLEARW